MRIHSIGSKVGAKSHFSVRRACMFLYGQWNPNRYLSEHGRTKFLQYGTGCAGECSEVTKSTVPYLLKCLKWLTMSIATYVNAVLVRASRVLCQLCQYPNLSQIYLKSINDISACLLNKVALNYTDHKGIHGLQSNSRNENDYIPVEIVITVVRWEPEMQPHTHKTENQNQHNEPWQIPLKF